MRIAFYHNHPSGGAARVLHELGQRLCLDHQIEVYTLSTGDEEFLPSRDYARSVKVFPFQQRPPIRFGLYLNEWRRYRDLDGLESASRRAASAIDAAGYDVVLVNACRFLQAPSVLPHLRTSRAYYCHEPPRRFLQKVCREDAGPLTAYKRLRSWWHWPGRAVLDSVTARRDRRNVAAADSVLTNSRFTAGVVERYYGRGAHVCRLGVDTNRFHPSKTPYGDYVLSVGALEPHKVFDFLVRSLGQLPEESRPELVIVANYINPGMADHLKRLAAEREVRLRLKVSVDEDELVRAYQEARAFVYAPHEEPFGLAVLEAMACGLPVVTVEEGGVVESIRPGVTGTVTPRDERQFADALSKVLSNPQLAQSMGREGRRLAETEWTWQAAGRRLEAALAATVAGTGERQS